MSSLGANLIPENIENAGFFNLFYGIIFLMGNEERVLPQAPRNGCISRAEYEELKLQEPKALERLILQGSGSLGILKRQLQEDPDGPAVPHGKRGGGPTPMGQKCHSSGTGGGEGLCHQRHSGNVLDIVPEGTPQEVGSTRRRKSAPVIPAVP